MESSTGSRNTRINALAPARNIHICPTCKIKFRAEGSSVPHQAVYQHMVRTHSMRINVACHPACSYLNAKQTKKTK